MATDQLHVIHCCTNGFPLDMNPPIMLISETNLDNSKSKLTTTTCLRGPEQHQWKFDAFSQLDKQDFYRMYGTPILRRLLPPNAKIVKLIWNFKQKSDGTHKACDCLNGKQLTRLGSKFEHTYTACMEQHCLRL